MELCDGKSLQHQIDTAYNAYGFLESQCFDILYDMSKLKEIIFGFSNSIFSNSIFVDSFATDSFIYGEYCILNCVTLIN